ncbi:hypothetical protein A3D78_00325 [Candidatus Gottesmanbacteria bacterium RIFCSPHIGHO2_02_FULL_39_14]|uniref:Purple acid phosphatase N-terminal domain-containing protein n=1 Tax=Candidatus Gottesmanbacteria bacterium RIFCSPHIGHO2_02_FULL_39_14 TaxID=1798383 RepID=A0A1F5ZWW6_9BACT|nr:MAG: hypothetical protein A3D78_00325 [Candidatus Gottesmanbacteria bacterium RIFCSPHIGHO2_02_FULL_39_14]
MTLGIFQKKVKYIFLVIISIAVFTVTIFLGKYFSGYLARAGSCSVGNVRAEKVSPNSSTIAWETDEATIGRVEYGTNANQLTFTAPEAEAATTHTVPLTLLTPNTVYYYLIAVGETKCDSSGEKCEEGCVPYSFTTSPLVVNLTETPTVAKTLPTQVNQTNPAPTSALSLFCRAVQVNIGKNSKVATEWATLKNYDIDGNGIINGLDVVKCQKSGK